MNRSVLICEIREIRGKKLFHDHLWGAGEARAGILCRHDTESEGLYSSQEGVSA